MAAHTETEEAVKSFTPGNVDDVDTRCCFGCFFSFCRDNSWLCKLLELPSLPPGNRLESLGKQTTILVTDNNKEMTPINLCRRAAALLLTCTVGIAIDQSQGNLFAKAAPPTVMLLVENISTYAANPFLLSQYTAAYDATQAAGGTFYLAQGSLTATAEAAALLVADAKAKSVDLIYSLGPFVTRAPDILKDLPASTKIVFAGSGTPAIGNASNAAAVLFKEDELGYLAGLLAGSITSSNHVACIAGLSLAVLRRFRNGFNIGARRACPTCTISGVYLASFGDRVDSVAWGRRLTSLGADVIFGAAGGAGSGAILDASNRSFLVIGVDADEYLSNFATASVAQKGRLLASAMKRTDVAVRLFVQQLAAGTFISGTRVLGLSSDAVGLAPCHDACGYFSAKLNASLAQAQSALRSGAVTTQIVGDTGEIDRNNPAAPFSVTTAAQHFGLPQTVDDFTRIAIVGSARLLLLGRNWATGFIALYNVDGDAQDYIPLRVLDGAGGAVAIAPTLQQFALTTIGLSAFVTGGRAGDVFSTAVYELSLPCSNPGNCGSWAQIQQTAWSANLDSASTKALTRTDHAAVGVSGLLYVFGGQTTNGVYLRDLWWLNVTSGQMTALPEHPGLPRAKAAMAAWNQSTAANGFAAGTMWLLVYGGEQQDVYGDLAWYNVAARAWVTSFAAATTVPPALSQAALMALSTGELLLSGGTNARGRSNATWLFVPASMTWALAPLLDLPAGGGAVYCSGRLLSTLPTTVNSKGPIPLTSSAAEVYCLPATATSTLEIMRLQVPLAQCNAARNLVKSAAGDVCIDCAATGQVSSADGLRCEAVAERSILAPVLGGSLGGAAALILLIVVAAAWRASANARNTKNAPRDATKPFAIAFTDIESSTALWARAPREMGPAIDLHHLLIRQVVKRHGGYEVKTIGDSFMVAFEDPAACVRFCADVQIALAQSSAWPQSPKQWTDLFSSLYESIALEHASSMKGHPSDATGNDSSLWSGLRVRIGAHYGQGLIKFDDAAKGYDYYGSVVNAAARIESVAHGGQTVVSRELYAAACAAGLDSGTINTLPLGLVPLRGLDQPTDLLQVSPTPLARRIFPPLRIESKGPETMELTDADNSTPMATGGDAQDSSDAGSERSSVDGNVDDFARRWAQGDVRRQNALLTLYRQWELSFAPFPPGKARAHLDAMLQQWRIGSGRRGNFQLDLMRLAKKVYASFEKSAPTVTSVPQELSVVPRT